MSDRFYDEWVSNEKNILKKIIKKAYYRIFKVVFNKLEKLEFEYNKIDDKYNLMLNENKVNYDNQLKINKEIYESLDRNQESMKHSLRETIREVLKSKWKLNDIFSEKNEKSNDNVKCIICNYSTERKNYKTKISECIFNGGRLERYVCPSCGAIFGPTKFLSLTPKERDEDYYLHYLCFSEGDSTYKEERAFYQLKPEKDKVYLNYGCGNWSKSIKNLRNKGYKIYGYEPYAVEDNENPYLITSKEKLAKMKFDGIYSNDLIEHLIDPIEDFLFMKSLLKLPNSKLSHSTSCYIYKYEYTRFHVCFFTGHSNEILSEKSGLKILEFVNDEPQNDFICCLYGPTEKEIDYMKNMYLVKDHDKFIGKTIVLQDNTLYGPYIDLATGKYILKFIITGIESENDEFQCVITAQKGTKVIERIKLYNNENVIKFELSESEENVEFVIENNTNTSLSIKEITLSI